MTPFVFNNASHDDLLSGRCGQASVGVVRTHLGRSVSGHTNKYPAQQLQLHCYLFVTRFGFSTHLGS